MSGSCICAICYEDVAPASELLQTIAGCGHVFHELCLQQWIEFCPNGRKPTCPLCKQCCAAKDVHRLYFQSSSETTSKQDQTSVQCHLSDRKSSGLNSAEVLKLEAKVRMLSNVCETSKKQISDLEIKEVRLLEQLQIQESENHRTNNEKRVLADSLARTREDLRKSTEQRQVLFEKNKMMASDLAVHRLTNDVNLTEDDMLKLASVGRGTNKDDVIEMMTKSLHLRNRAFKELMAKCQELGMAESRAQHKSEKLSEQLKRVKAKLKQVLQAEEEKENAVLRSLVNPNKPPPCHSSSGPDGMQVRSLTARDETRESDFSENRVSLSTLQPLNVIGRRQDVNSLMPTSVDLDSDAHVTQILWDGKQSMKAGPVASMDRVPSTQTAVREPNVWRCWDDNNENQNADTAISICAPDLSSFPGDLLDNEVWADEAVSLDAHGSLAGSRMQHLGTSKRIGLNGRPTSEDGVYKVESSSEAQNVRPRITIGVDGDIDNVEVLRRRAMIPIRQEQALGQGASFTQPSSLICGQNRSLPLLSNLGSSTYIVSGADGRGGRITVLKPPQGPPACNSQGAHRPKRPKSSSHISGGRLGALKIEHFFGRG